MINECKKCGSKNLYLEPRVKGQDILTANMVALKCKDCGSWLKWCPKDERKYYYANTQQKPRYQDTKWEKLKEWLVEMIKEYEPTYYEWMTLNYDFYVKINKQPVYNNILEKMQELEDRNEPKNV